MKQISSQTVQLSYVARSVACDWFSEGGGRIFRIRQEIQTHYGKERDIREIVLGTEEARQVALEIDALIQCLPPQVIRVERPAPGKQVKRAKKVRK